MPIPKEILAVKRPVNSIVIVYGKDKNLYAVRKREGCRYINGRHVPVNGPTIGHIVDGVYLPIDENAIKNVTQHNVDLKEWANFALSERLFADMLPELQKVFSVKDSLKIYSIAMLRVCMPGITNNELMEGYEDSFLSEFHPGVALSKNTVSTFLNNVGKHCSKIAVFMKNRAAAVKMDHLLIDGTLKSDESIVNSLSDFSRKARTKGTRDISVLYAFDLEKMEPVCSKSFPGNMLDATSYKDFITSNGITNGIIVADKGFPSKAAAECFKDNPDLHYLNPIKRNAKVIRKLNLLTFPNLLECRQGITWNKAKSPTENKWFYAFRDASRAAKEEHDWLVRARKKGNFNSETFEEVQKLFGTVVLESDLDLKPEIAYKTYDNRWEIELVMRYYKSACEFDETRVQNDYSVIGSEFCDFLATVLTYRLINFFDKSGLFEKEKMTYGKVMKILTRAKKVRLLDAKWNFVSITAGETEVLTKLKLLDVTVKEQPKRHRGRPKNR